MWTSLLDKTNFWTHFLDKKNTIPIMVSIYSFTTASGRPLSIPDIDDEDIDEDVGVYLENGCLNCRSFVKEIEALSNQISTLQSLLSHREHHLKVIMRSSSYFIFIFLTTSLLSFR